MSAIIEQGKMELEIVQQHKDVAVGTVTESLSPEEDRRILRKIDLCLLPVMTISYVFQFLDKSALANTAVLKLRQDLHLSGGDYSWASAIYYFGYLVASYPAGALMVRWKVGKIITASICAWGVMLMLTSVCVNAGGLLAVRFILGICEAPVAPGLTIIISMWYKRSEQPLRHAAWFLGNTFAGIVGGLLAYAIGHIETIPSWKAVFLIFGGVTVAWSFCALFLLPDVPTKSWFLGPADRLKAIARVEENLTGVKNDHFKWHQCREALLDVKTWLVFIIQLASNIPNGGLTSFGTIVTNGLGFGELRTLLVGVTSYAFQLFFVLLATGGSSYFRNTRTFWMIFNFAVSVVGVALVRQLPEDLKWPRFIGQCLAGTFTANFPLIMSLISGNFGGFTKKASVSAVVFIAYCTGNIIGPNLFFSYQSPGYSSGFLAMLVCYGVGIVTCLVLRFYLIWENRRRDKESSPLETNGSPIGIMLSEMDKTDNEIPQFRYIF